MPENGGQWKQFMSLMRNAVPAKKILVLAIALSVLEAAGGLIVPIFTRDLIDQFSNSGIEPGVIIWLTSAFILQAAAGGFSYYLMTYLGESFVRKIRERLWNHVLKLRIPYFDKHESGELISRVTQDTNTVKTLVTHHLVNSISGIISIIGALIILFVIDWKMTLIMLAAVPVSAVILVPLGRLVYRISLHTQDELASFSAGLGRVLSDIRLVKSHNAQALESKQGEEKIASLFRLGMREAKIQSFVSPLITTVILAVLVVLIGYGGARVAAGDLSAGTLVAVIIYMFQIVMPFSLLAQFFTAFQKAMGATERIQELLETETEPMGDETSTTPAAARAASAQDSQPAADRQSAAARHSAAVGQAAAAGHSAPTTLTQLPRSKETSVSTFPNFAQAAPSTIDWNQPLRFRGVSFSYGGEERVLRDLNFTIEPGTTVAFVGPSGAGKTTIFSLLERFYDATEGIISLGEQPINEMPLLAWREGIGYVLQESPVMSGTIRSNLLYGLSRSVSEAEIAEAVRQANATFIEQLPDGCDTEVGERGVKLSGGQRQRIAIARALLRDPKLLLLDEATSNLDSESESLVQEALHNLMRGRTTLIIAHRLSTVIGADRIIFLEKGAITGQGTHEELMATHPLYRKFVEQQMKQKPVHAGNNYR
jgi:ATP-binding cassette subfamily B protein AbcA/BmrA